MRKLRRSITAALLAVILATQSAFVYAEDITDFSKDSSAVVNEITDTSVSDNEIGEETVVLDVSGDDQDELTDVSDNDQDEVIETPETDDNSSNDEVIVDEGETTDVSDNDVVEDVSENDISGNDTWYNIPEGYVVSASDLLLKADMPNTIKALADAVEGVDYIADRVFALVNTSDEAELVAYAYNSEIINYEAGVVVLDIPDEVSVAEAVSVGANAELAMPIVYPDFYRYAFGLEDDEEIVEYDYSEDDSDFDDEYEDEYEDEEVSGNDEVYDLVASNVYTDPYLAGSSSYYQWHHDVIGSSYAWKKGYTGSGIRVAVLDTGVVQNHNDLSVAGNENFSDSSSAYDLAAGHGTHCAGIIAARANGSLGTGVAPNATLYNVKVLNDSGSGEDSGIIQGMNYAISLGVDVISMSLGGYGYSTAYKTSLNNAYEQGTVVVIAAGNDGGKEYNYPGSYDHVICVAATDKNNARADFSNYSNKVDVSAPGVDIWSVGISSSTAYAKMSGTSMATPVVAGEIAVILSAANDISSLKGKTGKARVNAVEKLIKASTKKCGSGMGKGIVLLPKALGISVDVKAPSKPVITVTPSANKTTATVTITSKSNNTIYYTVNGAKPSYKTSSVVGTKYSASFVIKGSDASKFTIRAIEVNSVGKSSKLVTKKVTLKSLVTAVTVSGAAYVAPGKSVTYKATVAPSYASTKSVTWSLQGTVPAGVSINASTGKLTVKSSTPTGGAFYVVATAKDGSGKDKWYVVSIRKNIVKTLSFKKKSITLERYSTNRTYSLYDTTNIIKAISVDGSTFAASDFLWSSSNPSVVAVDINGTIICYNKGSAKITVKAKDTSGKSSTITIKVNQMVTSASITAPAKLAVGTKTKMQVTVNPSNASNKKVKWSVEGTGVKIDSKGVLTVGNSASGTITVKATTLGSVNKSVVASKSITILSNKITGFSLTDTSFTNSYKSGYIFRTGGSFASATSLSFRVKINGNDGYDASQYTISNSAPNMVNMYTSTSGSGNIITVTLASRGTCTGTAKIKFESTDGSKKSATFTCTVKEPVTAIDIAPSKAGVGAYAVQGKSLSLKANTICQGKPSSTKVTWSVSPKTSSSYAGYISVSSKGKVTVKSTAPARSETYYIRATAKDGSGAYGDYEVTVITPTTYCFFSGMYSYYTYVFDVGYAYNLTVYYNGNTFYSPSKGGYYYAATYISSSNPAAVTAGGGGSKVTVAANKKGRSTVTMKTASGKSVSVKLWVK